MTDEDNWTIRCVTITIAIAMTIIMCLEYHYKRTQTLVDKGYTLCTLKGADTPQWVLPETCK